MKTLTYLVLLLIAVYVFAHNPVEQEEPMQEETNQPLKSYLVKTDMTRDELEELIALHQLKKRNTKNKMQKHQQKQIKPEPEPVPPVEEQVPQTEPEPTQEEQTQLRKRKQHNEKNSTTEMHIKKNRTEPEQHDMEQEATTTLKKVKKTKPVKEEKPVEEKPIEKEAPIEEKPLEKPEPIEAEDIPVENEPIVVENPGEDLLNRQRQRKRIHQQTTQSQPITEAPTPEETTALKVKKQKKVHQKQPEQEVQEVPEQKQNEAVTEVSEQEATNLLKKQESSGPGFFLSFLTFAALIGIVVYRTQYKSLVTERINKYLKDTFSTNQNEYLLIDNEEIRGML